MASRAGRAGKRLPMSVYLSKAACYPEVVWSTALAEGSSELRLDWISVSSLEAQPYYFLLRYLLLEYNIPRSRFFVSNKETFVSNKEPLLIT